MFRRIEMIKRIIDEPENPEVPAPIVYFKGGIMASGNGEVMAAWEDMNVPRRRINKNCRFYLTEEGWKRFGRPIIDACQRTGHQYRVIKIKERSVDVVYRDEIQVAVRPRKQPKNRLAD